MNLFTTKLRRTATVFGGSIAGLGIVAAMAGPALACDTKIKPSGSCNTTDGWTATWQVQNDYYPDATIGAIKLDGVSVQAVGDIAVGKTVKEHYGETVTGSYHEPSSAESADLNVQLVWPNNVSDWTDATAYPKTSDCETPPTTPPTTAPTTAPPTTPPTTPATTVPTDTTSPTPTDTGTPTETPTVPLPTPSTTASTEPVLPGEIFSEDCTSMTIGLDNTKGQIEYKLHFTPSSGSTKDLDIKAGEKKSVTFDASTGFSVKISIVAVYNGQSSPPETATVPYEKPSTCDSGSLPLTGSSAAPLAGGAAAIAAIGSGLFFLARRRKLKFTA